MQYVRSGNPSRLFAIALLLAGIVSFLVSSSKESSGYSSPHFTRLQPSDYAGRRGGPFSATEWSPKNKYYKVRSFYHEAFREF